jgi:hypothetical protein
MQMTLMGVIRGNAPTIRLLISLYVMASGILEGIRKGLKLRGV